MLFRSSRSVELGSTQRAAAHLQSLTDVNEAIAVGRKAVQLMLEGVTDVMVTIERKSNHPYESFFSSQPLHLVANQEKTIPVDWITKEKNGVNEHFLEYALPLIEGENPPKYENGIQRFTTFKKS